VQIVGDVLPNPAERELVFWKTSNKIFRLGLSDTDLITSDKLSVPHTGEKLIQTRPPAVKSA
jgi:hypothetical protein